MTKLASGARWILTLGLLGMSACAPVTDDQTVDNDGTVATAYEKLTEFPYRGGPGGSPFTGPLAPFAYDGFHIRTGSFVDQLIPNYYYPHAQGPVIGGYGGNDDGWQTCPNWLVGIYVRIYNHQFVSAIGLICGDYPDHFNNTVLGPFGPGVNPDEYFMDLCPVGEVVRQINGRSGAWLDGIQVVCGVPAV